MHPLALQDRLVPVAPGHLAVRILPVPLAVESSRTVSASLGQESVEASLRAGVVGLVMVALFMILYYRLPGLISVVALLIYTLLHPGGAVGTVVASDQLRYPGTGMRCIVMP